MAFLNSLNISGSALTAQRLRLDTISENISNMDTTRTENGGPYRRKTVVFQSIEDTPFRSALMRASQRGLGSFSEANAGVIVQDIVEDDSPFRMVYDPTHPDANAQGYVEMPNVDLLEETIDAMSASRSYEASVTAVNAVKLMASKALEVGK